MDADAGIPVGYWRSVSCSLNTFAVESMMDMLADMAGEDPFTFRIKCITDPSTSVVTDPRTEAVLKAARDLSFSWRNTLPSGHAWGIAFGKAFNTYVCEVVEISQPVAGSLKIHRVDCVVDCGIAVNLDAIEAQMQGGIIHGLNATLWGRETFVKGVAQQLNFKNSRMMRLSEAPIIQVTIMPSTLNPTGTGEPGVPPVAPAIANAYAKLTGTRVKSLPFFPSATMIGL